MLKYALLAVAVNNCAGVSCDGSASKCNPMKFRDVLADSPCTYEEKKILHQNKILVFILRP